MQSQISALLKCDVSASTPGEYWMPFSRLIGLQLLNTEPENEITLTAFRLLTMDLLVLFHVMNEGTINVLGQLIRWNFSLVS